MLAGESHENDNQDETFQPDSYIRVKSTGCYRQKMASQCSVKHFSLTLTSESSQKDATGKNGFTMQCMIDYTKKQQTFTMQCIIDNAQSGPSTTEQ